MSNMVNTYQQLANEADDATSIANTRPSENNHRRAASKHLAASCHAAAIGKPDEANMHDQQADLHLAAMKACQTA